MMFLPLTPEMFLRKIPESIDADIDPVDTEDHRPTEEGVAHPMNHRSRSRGCYDCKVIFKRKYRYCDSKYHSMRYSEHVQKELTKIFIRKTKNKRGDFDWSVSNDDIACIKWNDKRIVHILETLLYEATKSCEIERKEKDGKKLKQHAGKQL
ncbi:hypothetical protein TNCV_4067371 [Trichonephila clavipes]|nr:hypothetical protein TNCV_4067371 [Trichonephila clavipes]